MIKNVGFADRVIRATVGIALIIAGIGLQSTHAGFWFAALAGVILIATSAIAVCPAYLPFKFSTRKKVGH